MKEGKIKAAALKDRKRVDSSPADAAAGGGPAVEKIITLARKNGVPVHEDRNLIELLSTIDLYDEIPMELYKAVAGVLAYIDRTSGKL